jgi:hypothetical protein
MRRNDGLIRGSLIFLEGRDGQPVRVRLRRHGQHRGAPKHCADGPLPEVATPQLNDGLQGRGKLLGGFFEGKNQLIFVQADDIQQHL